METESSLVVVRGWLERRVGRNCVMGQGFSFGVMEIYWN